MDVDRMVSVLAERQHGAFALWQIDPSASLVRARRKSGRWIRIYRGVYRIAGAPETWEQAVMAAILAGGPRAFASYLAALGLHHAEGFPRRWVEVTVPRGQRVRGVKAKVHESLWIPEYVTMIDGIPVTTFERTVLDMGNRLPRPRLESIVEDGLRHRRTTVRALRERVEAHAGSGHRGIVAIRAVLDGIDPDRQPTDSELELRFLRLVRALGLPEPVVHYVVHTDDRVVGEIDFAWPWERIGVEMQSATWHVGRAKVKLDSRKLTELMLLGWRMCSFVWDDIEKRADWIGSALVRAFAQAGVAPESQA